jgi:hypothetical protein
LAGRSRKRGRREPRVSAAAPPTRPDRGAPEVPRPTTRPAPIAPEVPKRSRSEERNAAVRAGLTPLAPGERPWPIKVSAAIALFVGGGDLIDAILGGKLKVAGTHAGVIGELFFGALMLVCAVGMWQLRYWAVLGFQAILAFVILIFSLLLIRASNLLGFAVAIVVIGGGGYLFFKLVRVLSRIQTPTPPGR